MSLHIKGNPRPILTFTTIIVIGVIIGILIKKIGFFWVITIPNIFALGLMMVLLITYYEAKSPKKAAKDGAFPTVSVIVPSYNSKGTIMKCIESIKASDYPGKMEIIVVDDGSQDGSKEMLNQVEGINFMVLEKNLGKSGAINMALKIAKGEVIACVDSDSYPEPDALREAISMLMADENIGVVTCFIQAANPNTLFKKLQAIEYMTGFGFFHVAARFLDAISVAPGPTSIFRKSALEKIGGFDEGNITEDLEIAWRMRKYGYKIEYCPHAVSYTEVPETLSHLMKQRVRWYRGKYFNVQKHSDVLFNPKYGLFSMFFLPISFSAELSGVVLSFSFLYIIANQILWAAQYYSSVIALGGSVFLSSGGAVSISISALVMSIILVSPWFIVVYLSYLMAGKKFGLYDLLSIVVFFVIYGLVISAFYCITFLKEVNRSDYVWK